MVLFVRVVLAYTVPLDLLPLVTNAQYVVMLAGLMGVHPGDG